MADQTTEHPHIFTCSSLSLITTIVDILYKSMHYRMIYVYVNGACQQKRARYQEPDMGTMTTCCFSWCAPTFNLMPIKGSSYGHWLKRRHISVSYSGLGSVDCVIAST